MEFCRMVCYIVICLEERFHLLLETPESLRRLCRDSLPCRAKIPSHSVHLELMG